MQDGPIEFVQFVRLFDALGDGWLGIVVLGLFAGFLARMITTRQRRIGLLSTSLLGIAGAILGVGVARWMGFELAGVGARFVAAFAGSLGLALVGGMFRRRSEHKPKA